MKNQKQLARSVDPEIFMCSILYRFLNTKTLGKLAMSQFCDHWPHICIKYKVSALLLLWKRLVLIKCLLNVNISSCKVLFVDGISLISSGKQWVATGPPCSELIHRDMCALITHCVSNLNHYICKSMKPEQEFPAQDPHISKPHFFKPTPGCTVHTLPV